MLAEQRRNLILDSLSHQGSSISVVELSQMFRVSTMTIRRDLDQLETEQKVRRVHGGAIVFREDTGKPFEKRHVESNREKQSIGRLAASLVQDGQKIFLDAGTTTLAIAMNLGGKKNLTVITHALPIAQALCSFDSISTIFLGGMLKRQEQCAIGSMVVQTLSHLNADLFFLSAAGFDLQKGPTDPDLMEAEVKQSMIHSAHQVILVADSSKWGVVNLVQITTWSKIHVLVTDDGLPQIAIQDLESLGVKVFH